MNSNNWIAFPLSPTHPSLPPHIHSAQSSQFNLGLVSDNMDNPFQTQEWNLFSPHGGGGGGGGAEVPKVADFLGVSKSENQSDPLVTYNEIQTNDSDYFFHNIGLLPTVQSTGVVTCASNSTNNTSYELQESANNLQSLTLSMGSTGNNAKASPCETTDDNISSTNNNVAIVEATPRRTLDTFGQRTSIYRGVTR